MTKIQGSLEQFTNSLEQGKFVVCDFKQGTWKVQPKWMELTNALFRSKGLRLVDISKSFCRYLDTLETKPVLFGLDPTTAAVQKGNFATCFKAAEAVKAILQRTSTPEVTKQLNFLAQRTAALQYRIESANGGQDLSPLQQEMKDRLLALAAQWKSSVSFLVLKELSPRDIEKLERACQYPNFIRTLFIDKGLQDKFFSWAIRDNMPVDHFVQFPATCARIKSAVLAARIGRLGNELFPLVKQPTSQDGVTEKVLMLPFDVGHNKIEYHSILDESKEINVHGTWKLTIKKILDIFSYKNRNVGDLELFKTTGITVWNAFEIGRWNPEKSVYERIDLYNDDWWNELPVLEELTKSELEKKYNTPLEEGQWLICGKSSRQSNDLDLDGVHGFMEIAIPTDDGKYRTYPFANFPSTFPHTTIDLLFFLADTRPGKISYPDENVFYSHRQIASYPLAISREEGEMVMSSIRKDIISARYGDIIFQFAGDNCAFWAHTKLQSMGRELPNLYKVRLEVPRARNLLLATIFDNIRKTPDWMHQSLYAGVYLMFGGKRKRTVIENGQKVHKAQYDCKTRKESSIFHPGYLHEQILQGTLRGTVTAGH